MGFEGPDLSIVGFEGPGLGFHEFPGIFYDSVHKFPYTKSMDFHKDSSDSHLFEGHKFSIGFQLMWEGAISSSNFQKAGFC